MQRTNRITLAPLGTAFFLMLGLAIVPVSLKVAGVPITVSPRLAAAIDAWQQIAEILAPNSQRETVIVDSETAPANTADAPSDTRELACTRNLAEPFEILLTASQTPAPRRESRRHPRPKVTSRAISCAKRVVEAAAIGVALTKQARVIESLRAITLESVARGELIKSIDRPLVRRGLGGEVKPLLIPENLRVLMRMSASSGPSAAKQAKCKVRAALASARGLEPERTELTSIPFASPDHCEF